MTFPTNSDPFAQKRSEHWLTWNGTNKAVFSWEKQELLCPLLILHCGIDKVQTHKHNMEMHNCKTNQKKKLPKCTFLIFTKPATLLFTVSWGSCRGENSLCFQRFCLKSTDLLELEVCLSLAHPPSPPVYPWQCWISVCARVCRFVCVRERIFNRGTGATWAAMPVLINAASGKPIANAA